MCPELDQKTHVSHLLFHGNLLNALTQQEKISSAGAIITSISSVPICFWPSESDPSGSSGPHILKIPLSLISSFPISLPFLLQNLEHIPYPECCGVINVTFAYLKQYELLFN